MLNYKRNIPAILVLVMFLILSTGCEKKSEVPDLNGNYLGSYTRGDSVSAIKISINKGRYEGESDTYHFPAICKGTTGWDDYKIDFTDECIWETDFDQTLILNGRYDYAWNNGKLTFWRGSGDYYERYNLNRLKETN